MNRSALISLLMALPLAAGIVVACSADNDNPPVDTGGGKTEVPDAHTGVVVDPFGDGGGDAEPSPGGSGTCLAETKSAESVQLDILLLIDSTGSMLANNKWQNQLKALDSFFTDPRAAGIGIGIKFFPDFAGAYPVCDENVYAVPDQPIVKLDKVTAGLLSAAISNRSPLGGTPLGPAVQGGLRFATTWKQQNKGHNVVLVIATDGLPDETCQYVPPGRIANTLEAVKTEVYSAFNDASVTIPTYVVGVGTELAPLNEVAAAGGTHAAILVDAKKDIASQMVAAFDNIRRTQLSCEYPIPQLKDAKVDFTKVNIRFTDELGYVDFLYVPSKDKCGATEYGWYYDNPNQPTRILLCEPFCGEVRGSRSGKVDVQYGCARKDVIIK